jgi:hypothetical protein
MPYVSYGPTGTPGIPIEAQSNPTSPVGGSLSQKQLETVYDRPPYEMIELFARHAEYVGFATMVKALGWGKGAATQLIGHYEKGFPDNFIQFGTVQTIATGAGATQVMNLSASSMYNTGVTIGGAARQASYVQPGDVLQLASDVQVQVVSKDITVTPHRVTVKPILTTVNLATALTANATAQLLYNLQAEGSGLPGTRMPQIFKYNNTFGIIKNAWSSSGTEMTNTLRFQPMPGRAGAIYLLIEAETLARHERHRSNLLLFGQQTNNLSETSTELGIDVPIQATQGLVSFAKTSGSTDTYTPGSFTLTTDLDGWAAYMQDQRASTTNTVWAWMGQTLYFEAENAFVNILQQNYAPLVNNVIPGFSSIGNDTTTNAMQSATRTNTINFSIMAVSKGGYNFLFKQLDDFNDITGAGQVGFGYKASGIIHPTGEVKDRFTTKAMPLIGYQYKELDGYSRDIVVGSFSGVGATGSFSQLTQIPNASNQFDVARAGILSEIAFHGCSANRIIWVEPA